MRNKPVFRYLPSVVIVVVAAALWLLRFPLIDAWKLHGYTPSNQISQLAKQDTMTPAALKRLYVNRPTVSAKAQFSQACPQDDAREKTIVLGCYQAGQSGIHILKVDDSRLQGVEQVTVAHEMLHAAYERLSGSQRADVNSMLQAYADHELTDERIKDILQTYERTEPGEGLNEMHSIFGTEIEALPPDLENYYKRYFTDRGKVAAYAASYQAAFTSRQQAVAQYDKQLAADKQTIDGNIQTLHGQATELDRRSSQMDRLRDSDTTAYNAAVPGFNAGIDSYNTLAARTKAQIAAYNQLIAKRNAIALEERQLSSAISGTAIPAISR